eukprot:4400727-Amphidinium_carterae.1
MGPLEIGVSRVEFEGIVSFVLRPLLPVVPVIGGFQVAQCSAQGEYLLYSTTWFGVIASQRAPRDTAHKWHGVSGRGVMLLLHIQCFIPRLAGIADSGFGARTIRRLVEGQGYPQRAFERAVVLPHRIAYKARRPNHMLCRGVLDGVFGLWFCDRLTIAQPLQLVLDNILNGIVCELGSPGLRDATPKLESKSI